MIGLARVGGFLLVIAVVTTIAAGVGRAVGPIQSAAPEHGGRHGGHATGTETAQAGPAAGGLQVEQDGYRLQLDDDSHAPAAAAALRFRIVDRDGRAVTRFVTAHDKQMHVVVVRRDLDTYQHLHPVMGSDGTWRTSVRLEEPGQYRMFADFRPHGSPTGVVLGHDFGVAGRYEPGRLSSPTRTTRVDGYDVTLSGRLVAGSASRLTLTVRHKGEPVTDLQPHLAAYGHLVAIRDGDLAYLHVHPDGTPGDGSTEPGPDVVFFADVPSAGTYRLFLDFRHGDVVRTAAFTVVVGARDTGAPSSDEHHH